MSLGGFLVTVSIVLTIGRWIYYAELSDYMKLQKIDKENIEKNEFKKIDKENIEKNEFKKIDKENIKHKKFKAKIFSEKYVRIIFVGGIILSISLFVVGGWMAIKSSESNSPYYHESEKEREFRRRKEKEEYEEYRAIKDAMEEYEYQEWKKSH